MSVQSYIPRGGLYKHQESSSLSSMRDKNSLMRQWQSQRFGAGRSEKQNQVVSQLRTQVARLGNQQKIGNGLHPFKIYNFPSSLRRFHNADDWRRFKIRGGRISFAGSVLSSPCPGSDNIDQVGTLDNPFGDGYGLLLHTQVPPNNNAQAVQPFQWNEVAIPVDGMAYHFWVSVILPIAGDSWASISTNTDRVGIAFCPEGKPENAKIMYTLESFDATKVWAQAPFSDLYNYYIGSITVDNGSLDSSFPGFPKISIHQHRNSNIEIPGSTYGTHTGIGIVQSFRGDYNNSANYYVGDTVTITYADSTGVQSLYHYIYDPSVSSVYSPQAIPGTLIGVSPNGNSPDPWKLLSKSPSAADYHNGAYDGSKFYLRT